jgi:hypothetical protein
MAEVYGERIHTEPAVLDIGEDMGALVIYTRQEFVGKEIQVSLKGSNSARLVHTAVWARRCNGQTTFAGLYPSLPVGDYIIWTHPSREVTIRGGNVAEVDLRTITDIYVPYAGHCHRYGDQNVTGVLTTAGRDATRDLLPPRYQNGKAVSPAPMGAAPLRYTEDGQVAWNEIWTGFCDLALAGGPPHRGNLLEPVPPDEVKEDLDAYERVVAEIERGLLLVTGRPTVRSEKLGWVGLKCEDEEMALWLLRAIVVENVCVRREGTVLFLPAGPAFRLDKEIKNVVTVVAKTHHYWREHLSS